MSDDRVPCAHCAGLILRAARKCKHCKAWQPGKSPPTGAATSRFPRAALIVAIATSTVLSVMVTSRRSTVGSAPPLTQLPSDVHPEASGREPSPASVGPEPERKEPKAPRGPIRKWKARDIKVGDFHPIDVVFSASGETIYVSGDDATLREYKVSTGELLHKASLPAKGDRLRVLFGRYIAVLKSDPFVSRVPVMDTKKWDRDPIMLEVGASPGDIVELSDGTVVTATTVGHRVARFGLPSGRVLGDIVLPMTTGQLFLVRSAGRPYLAVLGALTHDRRPAGAWIDLFDPEETPFGATRRSIPVGRDLRAGSVSTDGSAVLLPDFASNSASLLRLRGETEARSAEVGQGPISAHLMNGDRFGVTLNQGSSSATVIPLSSFQPSSIMLPGVPRTAALSPDRSTLFVALGGADSPPREEGLAILGGEPPDLVATLPTGKGAIAVAASPDGNRAAVASYHDRVITIAE